MRRHAEFLLFLTTFVWASTFVATKIVLVDVSPLFFIVLRFAFASAIAFVIWPREILRTDLQTLKSGTILALFLGAGFVLQVEGLQYTTASKSAFITAMLVVFTPIAQIIIERRAPKLGNVVGIVFVSVGLWLLTSPEGSSFNIGDGLTLGAAILYALYIVYIDVFTKRHSVIQLFFLQLVVVLMISLFGAVLFEKISFHPTLTVLLLLAYLTIFATVISPFIQTKYQRESTPTRAAVIFSLEPVIAVVLAYYILGESMELSAILGGGLIVLGILISQLSDSLKKFAVLLSQRSDGIT